MVPPKILGTLWIQNKTLAKPTFCSLFAVSVFKVIQKLTFHIFEYNYKAHFDTGQLMPPIKNSQRHT